MIRKGLLSPLETVPQLMFLIKTVKIEGVVDKGVEESGDECRLRAYCVEER